MCKEVKTIIEAAVKVHCGTRLQNLIDDAVENRLPNLFKETQEKALTGIHTVFYEMIEKAAAKEICFGELHDFINIKIIKFAES